MTRGHMIGQSSSPYQINGNTENTRIRIVTVGQTCLHDVASRHSLRVGPGCITTSNDSQASSRVTYACMKGTIQNA